MKKLVTQNKDFTYEQAVVLNPSCHLDSIYHPNISLINAASQFLSKLSSHTRKNYETAFNLFFVELFFVSPVRSFFQ